MVLLAWSTSRDLRGPPCLTKPEGFLDRGGPLTGTPKKRSEISYGDEFVVGGGSCIVGADCESMEILEVVRKLR